MDKNWKVKDLKTYLETLDPEMELLFEGKQMQAGNFYVSHLDDGKTYLQTY